MNIQSHIHRDVILAAVVLAVLAAPSLSFGAIIQEEQRLGSRLGSISDDPVAGGALDFFAALGIDWDIREAEDSTASSPDREPVVDNSGAPERGGMGSGAPQTTSTSSHCSMAIRFESLSGKCPELVTLLYCHDNNLVPDPVVSRLKRPPRS